ncbi:MAG: DnaB-like helicase C-terminal domain-containing protein, partial [Myxococcota bacterium]
MPPARLFDTAERLGIREEMFGGIEARHVWTRIHAHYHRHDAFGRVPSLQTVQEWFPSLDLPMPGEAIDDLCGHVKEAYLRRRTDRLVDEYLTDAKEGVTAAMTHLVDQLSVLQEQSRVTTDINMREVAVAEGLADTDPNRPSGGMTGMPWPWKELNEATGGINPGDYIMLWGLPKSGKTMLGLYVAVTLYKAGYRVLVYSKEMSWKACRQRMCAMLGHIDYDSLKKGRLSEMEIER